MTAIDTTTILETFIDFMTILLVEIPLSFISATLDSGVIRDIWVGFFGNPEVIEVAFLFALMGGTIIVSKRNVSKKQTQKM